MQAEQQLGAREVRNTCTSALQRRAIEFIREHCRAGEVLLIAGSMEAAHDVVRSCCDEQTTSLIGVHRTTPGLLVYRLSLRSVAGRGLGVLRPVAAVAITARIVDQALRGKQLTYFAEVATMPGFPVALSRTIHELRCERIAASDLTACGAAGADLAVLLGAYERELRDRALIDIRGLYDLAAEAVEKGESPYRGAAVVMIDAPFESACERAFRDALVANASAAVVLSMGNVVERQAESPVPQKTGALEAACELAGSCLEALQRNLFSATATTERPVDDTVRLFSASTDALECVEIARRIHAAADEGTAFDHIAILLRSPEMYQPLVTEALRRAGIPAYFTTAASQPDPAGRALLALLICTQQNLSAAGFAEYLSLGQAPVASTIGWEQILNEAAVIEGRERWTRRLSRIAEEYTKRADAAGTDKARDYWETQLERVTALEAFAVPMIARLGALPQIATWQEWLDALYELADEALTEPDNVFELLQELQPMGDIEQVTLNDVLMVIADRLRTLRPQAQTDRYGKVFVGGIDEARGLSFSLVFVPGMCEGSFPKATFEDPLLLDEARRALPAAIRLSTESSDRDLLCTAVACASGRIVFSYPRIDVLAGRERVPSLYLFEAMRAARGASQDVRALLREAAEGVETRLGWPAPETASTAVDSAEYDLAALQAAIAAKKDRNEGGGAAYLKQVNPHLVSALRTRWKRWHNKWSDADGVHGLDIDALKVMEAHRPSQRVYSVSELQQYAACPYKFALRAIYHLQPLEQPVALEQMDARLRGGFFHRVMFTVFRALAEKELLPVNTANLHEAFVIIDAVVDSVSEDFREENDPLIPQAWDREVQRIRADVRGWFMQKATFESDWMPVAYELAFGLKPDDAHDPRSTADPVRIGGELSLRGSIDLLEKHVSGTLRITDYKTGAVPKDIPQTTGKGEVLQPLLYSLVAEQLLNEHAIAGRLAYATLRANYRNIDIAANPGNRQVTLDVIRAIDAAIYAGFLPAAPREDACKHCDYRPVCGPYEEDRVKLKAQAELKKLNEIRRIP